MVHGVIAQSYHYSNLLIENIITVAFTNAILYITVSLLHNNDDNNNNCHNYITVYHIKMTATQKLDYILTLPSCGLQHNDLHNPFYFLQLE